MNVKIKTLEELSRISDSLKKMDKRVVHCHGVFDLLHPGHIKHLETAKSQGDVLLVTITADEFVNKGPGRPAFNHGLRAESLSALSMVDYVAINFASTAVDAINVLKPTVYVKGNDYANKESDVTGKIHDEEDAVTKWGGRIFFTNDPAFSSSNLINEYIKIFPDETEVWLRNFRKKYSCEQIFDYLDRASKLKVLVLGEAIIDEYVFCEALGKSSKDPILASQFKSIEAYAGGSIAVANHLAGFVQQVDFATYLGDQDRKQDFVQNSLKPNVNSTYFTHQNAPTIHKRRFLEYYAGSKLFELYTMSNVPLTKEEEAPFVSFIEKRLKDFDLVVVMDYGHGMMTQNAITTLCRDAKFMAVNTQANAGNRGFNTISRYSRADYVCLADHEVALETRMRYSPWQDLALEVTRRIACPKFTITHGKRGSSHYQVDQGFTEVPALATRIVDRVGAGDAVMAITSLMAKLDAPWEITGFLGNLAGAQLVSDLGNRVILDKISLSKHITSLLK